MPHLVKNMFAICLTLGTYSNDSIARGTSYNNGLLSYGLDISMAFVRFVAKGEDEIWYVHCFLDQRSLDFDPIISFQINI